MFRRFSRTSSVKCVVKNDVKCVVLRPGATRYYREDARRFRATLPRHGSTVVYGMSRYGQTPGSQRFQATVRFSLCVR